MDYNKKAIALYKKHRGKIEIKLKVPISNKQTLSTVYTPGVAEISRQIYKDEKKAYEMTMKANSLAVVSDGSAVLGLGNIGALAAIPVMEGKAALFKKFANIDAFPICIKTQNSEEIIKLVKNISPNFAAINLEDISAPRCFEIEKKLQNIGIPVMHDDQHGTAVVVLASLINALKITNKNITNIKIVINGAGSAGYAILKLLHSAGVKDFLVCDTKGVIYSNRSDIKNNAYKQDIARITNKKNIDGGLPDALKNADIFIGVSAPNVLKKEWIKSMNKKPIIFALANPTPEIFPTEALNGGAFIVATGRSDFPNQINNALAFPGIFRGAIDARALRITKKMKLAASFAIASFIKTPKRNNFIPAVLNKKVHLAVARAVKNAAEQRDRVCNKDFFAQ
ncbi:NADP-dependent malic enzyme [Candidatus Parcubacteria bacterium]|nr:NADP-dependent malic enzyme [Candidatus Parcubacteria bacterium]